MEAQLQGRPGDPLVVGVVAAQKEDRVLTCDFLHHGQINPEA